jgi:phage terminase large subunit-like protein
LEEEENAICPVLDYAEKVVSGEIIAGEPVQLACQRHIENLRDSKLNVTTFEYYFDDLAADHAIRFYDYLKHSKGKWARQSFILEPWQKFIVGSLFGWLHKTTQLRRFRTAYDEIPRKNGKTTLASGVGDYLFIGDDEYGAEVYACATKKDQAKLTFDESKRMVRASPDLSQFVRIHENNMYAIETGSKYEPLAADSNSLDGLNVHGGIIDEYHAHKNANLYHVIESGTSAREQPMIFVITTAGSNQHGPCYQLRDYALKVLKKIHIDETFFAYIATVDEGDDVYDINTWMKANPNLGVSKNLEYMTKQAAKAKQMPTAFVEFLTKDLNVWTNASVKWMPLSKWDACKKEHTPELLESLKGRKCYAGLDLSSKTDITALALIFPPDEKNGDYIIIPYFWIPEDDLQEREDRDKFQYRHWVNKGVIQTTPGNTIDYSYIKETIINLGKEYKILEIAFDEWNATQIALELSAEGFTMIPARQGFKTLSEPMKELERLVLETRFIHGGNPVLRWMADAVVAKVDTNTNIMPDKSKSTNRIDGIAACINALRRIIDHQTKKPSIYQTRGATSI